MLGPNCSQFLLLTYNHCFILSKIVITELVCKKGHNIYILPPFQKKSDVIIGFVNAENDLILYTSIFWEMALSYSG